MQGSCQKFARNCATRNLTPPHERTLGSALHLLSCVDRRGGALRREPPAHQWHARGQGFKSPQLHQAQRIGRAPAQGRLSADCQQITPCGGNNALSAARFRRLQAILTRRIGHEQGRPGRGRGSAPAAHLDPLTTATPDPRSRLWPRSWGRASLVHLRCGACLECRRPPGAVGPSPPSLAWIKAERSSRGPTVRDAFERQQGDALASADQ